MSNKVRIYPKRREIDVDRLAEALLNLVAFMEQDEQKDHKVEANEPSKPMRGGRSLQKGTAA